MQELNKIKGYRVMIGLTQAEMAKAIGMSERAYIAKENDNSKFTLKEINSIVEVLANNNLNIKPEELL